MLKKSLIALSLLTLPLTASANWTAGAGYANLSDEDLSLDIIYGAVAYEFSKQGSKLSFVPELRLGTGISDDKLIGIGGGVKVEVKSFTALSVRAQYNYDNGVYLYAMPSYANIDVKASSFYGTASDDAWELGFGVGVGKNFNEKVSVEASYESYDGTDMVTVGFKYAF